MDSRITLMPFQRFKWSWAQSIAAAATKSARQHN
jgi:hypothetical protein